MNDTEFIEKARQYAFECHVSTNHLYGGKHPYSLHLNLADDAGLMFLHLIPQNKWAIVRASIYNHDCQEDCRITWNDMAKVLGEEVAEIVYAVTNEKGRTRKERANKKYYDGIKAIPYAIFVKLCDKIANVTYSKSEGSSMFDKYKKEHHAFKKALTRRNWLMTAVLWIEGLFGYKAKN